MIKAEGRARETASWIKCWPCKHVDLSLDPQGPCNSLGVVVGPLDPILRGILRILGMLGQPI